MIIIMHSFALYWPIYHFTINPFFKIGPIRSDWMISTVFHIITPVIVSVYTTGDAFKILKIISLMVGILAINICKYNLPHRFIQKENNRTNDEHHARLFWCAKVENNRIRNSRTIMIYGLLIINILEAIIWEIFMLQKKYYNFINATAGLLHAFSLSISAWKFGSNVHHFL